MPRNFEARIQEALEFGLGRGFVITPERGDGGAAARRRAPLIKPAELLTSLGPTRGARAIMGWLMLMTALAPIIFTFAHRGVAPLAVAMGAAVALRPSIWAAGVPRFLTRPRFDDPLVRATLCLLGFCLWAALSALWSPSPNGWKVWLNVAAPALAAGAVAFEIGKRSPAEQRALEAVCEFALCAAAALLLFESLTGGLLRDIIPPADQTENRVKDMIALGRGVTALTTVLFAGLALMAARVRPFWFLAVVAGATYVAASRLQIWANELALIAGGAAFALAWRWPRSAILGLALAALTLLAAAPLAAALPVDAMFSVAPEGAPISWLQRFVIWKTSASEALSCLPWGCGAEYARDLSARTGDVSIPGAALPLPILPIHPHNVFLEIWLELGLPGAILFGGAILAGAEALLASPLSRPARAAALATATSVFANAMVETSLWQIWRHAALVLAALFIALADARAREKTGQA